MNIRRLRFLPVAVLAVAVGMATSATAAAAQVRWEGTSTSNTAAAPGETLEFAVTLTNLGDVSSVGTTELTATLPEGLIPTAVTNLAGFPIGSCVIVAAVVTCEISESVPVNQKAGLGGTFRLLADVDSGADGSETVYFEASGGGAPSPDFWADPVQISGEESPFGIDAFDALATDGDGSISTQAGRHPSQYSNSFDFNRHTDSTFGSRFPVEDARDVFVDLPPGFVGAVVDLPQCTLAQLANGTAVTDVRPACAPGSQLGIARIRIPEGETNFVAIYNLAPPPGVPARFGLNVAGTLIVLDTHLVSDDDGYHLRVGSTGVAQALAIDGNSLEFWGVPADPAHESQRSCAAQNPPSQGGTPCPSDAEPRAFFRNPTTCAGPAGLTTTIAADSWQNPGDFALRSIQGHDLPGYSFPESEWGDPLGIEGCDEVPFEPTLDVDVTTNAADSPTGLSVDLGLPDDCWLPKATAEEAEEALCQSDLRSAAVTLPPGLALNPSAANGRKACSPAQAGVTSPVGRVPVAFDEAAVTCPDASKIGTVEVQTPLLDDPLGGAVYLAEQSHNPFGSLLAMYLVIEGQGIRIKQAGRVQLGEDGQLTTVFEETPQTPFSNLHVELFGGPRAALRTPAACGTHTATAKLTPWSGTGTVQSQGSFQVSEGCGGGFDPKLSAGTETPLAGSSSPFNLRITRADATQEVAGLQIDLPPGLLSSLKGYAYCSDAALAAVSEDLGTGRAQEAAPACPASSLVGTVTVGAGAGVNPFYTTAGRAYLAGPYKGAPVSLAVIAPAVAGPFDLGSVLVRNAIYVDPTSSRLRIASDPIPTVLHGVPLDLRDVRVHYNQTLNPTSCEPFQVGSKITSAQGATASPSVHFQAAGCDRLGYKPRLVLRLKGGIKRSANPALTAVMRPRAGDANSGRIQVALPHSEFLAQAHIRTICTRVQFAANQCPKGSIYGRVSAVSPILDYVLTGNVYLRSSDNPLPDLVLALRGPAHQPVAIDAVGRIDQKDGGIRTTFSGLPDAPLTRVVLRMQGGEKSLLENSVNICRRPHRATVQMDGQNGKLRDFRPKLRVACGKRK